MDVFFWFYRRCDFSFQVCLGLYALWLYNRCAHSSFIMLGVMLASIRQRGTRPHPPRRGTKM